MQVVLKIVGGKNDGKKIQIKVSDFVIGRGKEAQLRPSSDLISREHCAVRLRDGKVVIEDMGSRNGTFVNGKQLTSPHQAKSGDNLRVGRIQFEVLIDHAGSGIKKPKISDVGEAAQRTATSDKSDSIEDSITDWLSKEEDGNFDDVNFGNKETLQFNLDDLDGIQKADSLGRTDSADSSDSVSGSSDELDAEDEDGKKKKKKKKKEYGLSLIHI